MRWPFRLNNRVDALSSATALIDPSHVKISDDLMPNHYHLVLRPQVDGEMSRFMGWVGGTHTMRYHAHYQTSGYGHVYQQRNKSFPIQDDEHFLVVCRYVERNALRAELVARAEDWRWGSFLRSLTGRCSTLCEETAVRNRVAATSVVCWRRD